MRVIIHLNQECFVKLDASLELPCPVSGSKLPYKPRADDGHTVFSSECSHVIEVILLVETVHSG